MTEMIDDRINESLDNMQKYIDVKFASLNKLVAVERELALKQRELDELRAKGMAAQRGRIPKPVAKINNDIEFETGLNVFDSEDDDKVNSELMVYRNAVKIISQGNRGSSSSEELMNISDKTQPNNRFFVTEAELERSSRDQDRTSQSRDNRSKSRDRRDHSMSLEREDFKRHQDCQQQSITDKSEKLIREAEASKARVYKVAGRNDIDKIQVQQLTDALPISAVNDESY